MSNPVARVDDLIAHAREADRRQAEYYRALLAHQRAAVAKQLAVDEFQLDRQRNSGNMRNIKRLKRAIRRKENERNSLDHLIAELDRRLTTPIR
jgi:septal ring factor EnvC (AmiA/AmiB activator)